MKRLLKDLREIQITINGREDFLPFGDLSQHLWDKYSRVYNYNLLDFWNYLDSGNRNIFERIIYTKKEDLNKSKNIDILTKQELEYLAMGITKMIEADKETDIDIDDLKRKINL